MATRRAARKTVTKPGPTPRARRPAGPGADTAVLDALSALREEVSALRRDLARAAGEPLRESLRDAVARMARARAAIRDGLATLPRDPAYARAADHLRELVTVSPSIAQLFTEVNRIGLPLGEAITSLQRAAEDLEEAEARGRRALEEG